MTAAQEPFLPDREPFAGFEVQVMADRTVYGPGDVVRLTVSATNHADRFVEQRYPGWQRFVLSVRDERHRVVASDEVRRTVDTGTGEGFTDRWLPGQMLLLPTYWSQAAGPVRPAWSTDPPGSRVPAGRYRARASWLGREPGTVAEPPDAWSAWFEIA